SVRNVVLIDKLDLDFSKGLSVFSGETGAGKSILLDCLGLVLGNRAETGLIRKGEDKLIVSAVFELKDQDNPFFKLCAENDLEIEQEIIIKRSITADGKSKIFLNDQPITQRLLKELGLYLVEIHGQFDNQGLLNSATHLSVLDNFGGYQDKVFDMAQAYSQYKNYLRQLENAKADFLKNSVDEENIKHWVDELEKANVKVGEFEELSKKRIELMNAEKIVESFNVAYSCLQTKDIASLLQKAQSAISKVNQLTENKFEDISELLDTALIDFDEAVNRIEQASYQISHNSNEAENIEERIFALRALARKHQCDVDDLPTVLQNLHNKLLSINNSENKISELNELMIRAKEEYVKKATVVRNLRLEAAKNLDTAVAKELPPLKMEKATFVTNVEPVAENLWSKDGMDNVFFTVATNVGSEQEPLNKIASGGELARFMLALKVNLAQKSFVETLIFDEVDAGIGGATAQAVGERLKKLSNNVQVLVVTHSPQVAAFSKDHFKVCKNNFEDTTTTSVSILSEEQKQEEIARMLSGDIITDEARAAANVLISKC
ncbi:MAG: DNA repair protein RecN, partial [Alphaproteobacteria bacterium]|nr:DNA repair protein RecN [Alphaproteobacteria bacterium]